MCTGRMRQVGSTNAAPASRRSPPDRVKKTENAMGVGSAANSLLAARASGAPLRPRGATAAARLDAQYFYQLLDGRAQLPLSNIVHTCVHNKSCAKLLLVQSKVVNMQQINGSHCLVHFATTYWDHIGSVIG